MAGKGGGGGNPKTRKTTVTGSEIVALLDSIVRAKVPYVYGGDTMKGFDCSGLVQYVYSQYGIKLPRTSEQQSTTGTSVTYQQLQPGDLVFSQWPGDSVSPGHVAIYVGGGNVVEAPKPGEDVQVSPLDSEYQAKVTGYRRVSGITDSTIGSTIEQDASSLISWPSDIVGFFSEAADDLSSTASFFSAFTETSTWVRIGAGIGGSVCVVAGLVFLLMASRS